MTCEPQLDLPRPTPAVDHGQLDDDLYDLVERRFRRLLVTHPPFTTHLGVHDLDDVLGDGSRDAVEQELADDRAHVAAVDAIDPARLSGVARFERDLELHNVQLSNFRTDEVRGWARRSTALDIVVEQTRFQRSVARAEVNWYTNRPTYPMSYLLGRTMLLALRADEQRRLGDAFSLKAFHDALMEAGSLPISFQRRLLHGGGRAVTPMGA